MDSTTQLDSGSTQTLYQLPWSMMFPLRHRHNPLQRYWRDVHAGLNHVTHVPGSTFHASTLCSLGIEPQGPLRAMI